MKFLNKSMLLKFCLNKAHQHVLQQFCHYPQRCKAEMLISVDSNLDQLSKKSTQEVQFIYRHVFQHQSHIALGFFD